MSDTSFFTEEGGERSAARAAARERRRQERRRRTIIVLSVFVVLFGVATFAGFKILAPMVSSFGAAEDYEGQGTGEVTISIEPGDAGNKIARKLLDQGVIKSTQAFMEASVANEQSNSIQPGQYVMPQQIPAATAVDILVAGDSKQEVSVQVAPGLWVSEIIPIVAKNLEITEDESKAGLEAAKATLPAFAEGNPEGYLFPDTYSFNPDVSAQEVYERMIKRHKEVMDELGVPEEDRQRLTIEASVIVAEGGQLETMKKVATVINNRLALPMRLQMDSTVSYAAGKRKIDTTENMRSQVNDYNTYAMDGLPKAPIANPGRNALEAAVNPTPGDWLFFVAVNTCTGETKFAEDVNGHQKNVNEWKAWAKETGGCEQ